MELTSVRESNCRVDRIVSCSRSKIPPMALSWSDVIAVTSVALVHLRSHLMERTPLSWIVPEACSVMTTSPSNSRQLDNCSASELLEISKVSSLGQDPDCAVISVSSYPKFDASGTIPRALPARARAGTMNFWKAIAKIMFF